MAELAIPHHTSQDINESLDPISGGTESIHKGSKPTNETTQVVVNFPH